MTDRLTINAEGFSEPDEWPDLATLPRGIVVALGVAMIDWVDPDLHRRAWTVLLTVQMTDGAEVIVALDEDDLAAIPKAAALRPPVDPPRGGRPS